MDRIQFPFDLGAGTHLPGLMAGFSSKREQHSASGSLVGRKLTSNINKMVAVYTYVSHNYQTAFIVTVLI